MYELQLSVVVCTRDRVADLQRGLPALLTELDGCKVAELVVVDNASTDATPKYLAAMARQASLRVLREETTGLILARNAGWRAAAGRVVAYLDDDAVVEPGWLAAVLAVFDDGATGMGGRIRLAWPDRRPDWLPPELDSLYSAFDLGLRPTVLAWPAHPFGANMAVLRAEIEAAGGFVGRARDSGRSLFSNDEKPVFASIAARRGTVVYEPAASVVHHVAPSRVEVRWLLRRSWFQGRSDAALDPDPPSTRRLLGAARPRTAHRRGDPWPPAIVRAGANSASWLGFAWETLPPRLPLFRRS